MSQLLSYDTGGPSQRFAGIQRAFPDPYRTYTTVLMPRSVGELMRWCEGMWLRNGTYARALQRVVAYFITKVEVTNCSDDEKKKYEEFLNETLSIPRILYTMGIDFMAYGNSFSSLYIPFKRSLMCSECNIELPIQYVDYTFDKGKFKWKCEHCHKESTQDKPKDRRLTDENKIVVKRWSPHEIRIMEHPISKNKIYMWDPPRNIVQKILNGDRFYLESFPWEMIEAILQQKMFEFAPRVIFHMAEESLAGVKAAGWGIPQTLTNFHHLYYVQQAKMYNEVLMNEYIVPFRVISPAKASGASGDPILNTNIGSFNNRVQSMLEMHRRNPGGYYALPFPVEYQALSGEGSQLTTHEHIAAATDEMLNAAGVPAELYKGTLQFEALPTALRLFQQTWPHLKANFDGWLDWLMQTLATVFNWDRARARLQPVTLADDLEKRSILLQLLAGNRVSAETALSPLGIDAEDELRKIFHEQKAQIEEQSKFDQEMQQKQDLQQQFMGQQQQQAMQGQPQQPGAAPQPSGGMGGSNPAGTTPEDIMLQAQQEAQRLLAMPYEMRRSEMLQLKKTNETLHALVKAQLEQIRQGAASQGQQQVIQQQVGGPQGQFPQG